MDAENIVKILTAAVAVIAPAASYLSDKLFDKRKSLASRHEKLKDFFHDGGDSQHPALRESSFAVAVGHEKIGARAIPVLLNQDEPLRFIRLYAPARSYLAINSSGTRLELVWLAKRTWVRRSLLLLGGGFYLIFVIFAVWVLLYRLPALAVAGAWMSLALNSLGALLFAAAGAWCLVTVSPLHWAKMLCDEQRKT
jgi:hypothetical protein